jgi:hypothetical protein
MSYKGLTPLSLFTGGTLVKDRFSGDASTTGFTMSQTVNDVANIDVFVDNVRQEASVAYTVSGTTLNFTGTPPSGTNNIYVIHRPTISADNGLLPQESRDDTVTNITVESDLSGRGQVAGQLLMPILLDGTDGSSSNAGDNLTLDGTDSISANAGSHILYETGMLDVNVNGSKTVGRETVWIPSSIIYPSTTNGCAALAQVETTALRPDLKVLDFDASSDEFAQFTFAFPKSWNKEAIQFQPYWTVTGTNTGSVKWELAAVSLGNDESINTVFGNKTGTTALAHSGTSNDLMVSAESGDVFIGGLTGTAEDSDLVYFQINRDVDSDNQSGDARLLGVKLYFTTNAANDD